MIIHPFYLLAMTAIGSVLLSALWQTGSWIDPLNGILFLLGFQRPRGAVLYIVLAVVCAVDTAWGSAPGTLAVYYLVITYLGMKSAELVNVRTRASVALSSLIAIILAYCAHLAAVRMGGAGHMFPFSPASLPVGSLIATLLWKPSTDE